VRDRLDGIPARGPSATTAVLPSGPAVLAPADAADPALIARRRRLKAAIFGRVDGSDQPSFAMEGPRRGLSSAARAVAGQVLDVSPHVLVIGSRTGEERFALTATQVRGAGGIPARRPSRSVTTPSSAGTARDARSPTVYGRISAGSPERSSGTTAT
jgi:hypothetical protein